MIIYFLRKFLIMLRSMCSAFYPRPHDISCAEMLIHTHTCMPAMLTLFFRFCLTSHFRTGVSNCWVTSSGELSKTELHTVDAVTTVRLTRNHICIIISNLEFSRLAPFSSMVIAFMHYFLCTPSAKFDCVNN